LRAVERFRVTHEQVEELAERRANDIAEIEFRLLEHTLGMAHGLEAFMAVISAHAAFANAAEGNVLLGVVQNGIVDGDAAGGRALQHELASWPLRAKEVERERPRSSIDIGDGVFELAIGYNRQDRAEDLILHHIHLVRRIEHERR